MLLLLTEVKVHPSNLITLFHFTFSPLTPTLLLPSTFSLHFLLSFYHNLCKSTLFSLHSLTTHQLSKQAGSNQTCFLVCLLPSSQSYIILLFFSTASLTLFPLHLYHTSQTESNLSLPTTPTLHREMISSGKKSRGLAHS